jgi:hypothetical protein
MARPLDSPSPNRLPHPGNEAETVQPSDKPKRRDDIHSEELQHETVLYDQAHGQAVYLNESASVVWKLCDGSRTVSEMSDLLSQEIGQAADPVARTVAEIVGRFQQAGLVD